jgi:inorganic pyrophosphatase
LAGFGLGASVLSLFGRVSGGIFSQSVEVGCDTIGRLDADFKYAISNPAIIANKVGDNVRDVIGAGTDEFGSFAEATSAALVIAAISPSFYYQPSAFWYILLITAFGIVACIITSVIA